MRIDRTRAFPGVGGPKKCGPRPLVYFRDGAVEKGRRDRIDSGIANETANEITISRVLYRGLDGIRVDGGHRDTPVEENRAGQASRLKENQAKTGTPKQDVMLPGWWLTHRVGCEQS